MTTVPHLVDKDYAKHSVCAWKRVFVSVFVSSHFFYWLLAPLKWKTPASNDLWDRTNFCKVEKRQRKRKDDNEGRNDENKKNPSGMRINEVIKRKIHRENGESTLMMKRQKKEKGPFGEWNVTLRKNWKKEWSIEKEERGKWSDKFQHRAVARTRILWPLITSVFPVLL